MFLQSFIFITLIAIFACGATPDNANFLLCCILYVGLFALNELYIKEFSNESNSNTANIRKSASNLVFIILAIIITVILSCFSRIKTGHTGILVSFGRVEEQTYSEGIVFRPFWKNMIQMDNRVQKNGHDDKATILEVYTKDSQEVDIEYTVLYKLNRENASRLYKEIGVDYYKTVLVPIVQEEVKKECAKYQADEFLAKREELAQEIEENIKKKFKDSYIDLVSTSIQDLKFTEEYEKAVEQKQIAMQSKLKAEQDAEKLKIEIDAKAYSVEKTAEAEARANEMKQKTITDNLIKYEMIQKWNGELPKVEGGGQAIIDMRGIE